MQELSHMCSRPICKSAD